MKKNIVRILSLAAAVAVAASCSDFLDIRVEATMPSTGTDYSKAENIFQPVSAAYAQMRADIWFPYISITDITSDDSDKGSTPTDNAYAKEMEEFTFTPSNYMFNSLWVGYYDIISAANNALIQEALYCDAMTTADLKLECRKNANEAKVIRAYAYLELMRTFGSVPVVEGNMTSEQLADNPPVSLDKLYQYVCKDLDEAIDTLPESYGKAWGTRYTKYTALAVKAKLAMYQADWATAAAAANEIIASGKFALQSDLRYLFSIDGEGCSESLMEIESSDLGQSSGSAPYVLYGYYQGPRNNKPSGMQGWGFNVPNTNLLTFMQGRGESKRIDITFLERGTTTPEGDYISEDCPNRYYNGKVYTPNSTNTYNTNAYAYDHNIRLIRYAEILLIYAEAALHLVQDRAGIAQTSATLENIYDERRAELALEGNRIFDLMRLGRVGDAVGAQYPKAKTNFHTYFPIPSTQITLNKGLEPTPGYTY